MKVLRLVLILVAAGAGLAFADPDVIGVAPGDAEMEAAMQHARDQFTNFWSVVSADRERTAPALVKAYFVDPGKRGGGEHLWISDVEFDGTEVRGVVVSTPNRVRMVKAGDKVSLPLEQLSDWLYVENGKAVGAFTVQLLRSRMSEDQRREHDAGYEFAFE